MGDWVLSLPLGSFPSPKIFTLLTQEAEFRILTFELDSLKKKKKKIQCQYLSGYFLLHVQSQFPKYDYKLKND